MICPKCGVKAFIKYTHTTPKETVRKQQCKACGHIFYTSEKPISIEEGRKKFYEIEKRKEFEKGLW